MARETTVTCDRCAKTEKLEEWKMGMVAAYGSDFFPDKTYDLCPECVAQVVFFIESREVPAEIAKRYPYSIVVPAKEGGNIEK